MFDEWLNWISPGASFREWSLFRVMWDRGMWWAFDLDNAIIFEGKKYGYLEAFVEVTILGVGLRYNYRKKVIFDEQTFLQTIEKIGEKQCPK